MEGINDLFIDEDDKFLTFSYSQEKGLNQEIIKRIPVETGYPPETVKIIVYDEPIEMKE